MLTRLPAGASSSVGQSAKLITDSEGEIRVGIVGRVAQLVRARSLYLRGPRFESWHAHTYFYRANPVYKVYLRGPTRTTTREFRGIRVSVQ